VAPRGGVSSLDFFFFLGQRFISFKLYNTQYSTKKINARLRRLAASSVLARYSRAGAQSEVAWTWGIGKNRLGSTGSGLHENRLRMVM
jgi:hypothetical protein